MTSWAAMRLRMAGGCRVTMLLRAYPDTAVPGGCAWTGRSCRDCLQNVRRFGACKPSGEQCGRDAHRVRWSEVSESGASGGTPITRDGAHRMAVDAAPARQSRAATHDCCPSGHLGPVRRVQMSVAGPVEPGRAGTGQGAGRGPGQGRVRRPGGTCLRSGTAGRCARAAPPPLRSRSRAAGRVRPRSADGCPAPPRRLGRRGRPLG